MCYTTHLTTLNSYYHNVFYDYYKWLYMLVMGIMLSLNLVKVTGWIVGYAYISMWLIVVMDGYRMIIGGYMVVMHG